MNSALIVRTSAPEILKTKKTAGDPQIMMIGPTSRLEMESAIVDGTRARSAADQPQTNMQGLLNWKENGIQKSNLCSNISYRNLESIKLAQYSCQPSRGRWISQHLSTEAHPYLGVHIVTGGRGNYRFDREIMALSQGQLLILPSHTPLEIEAQEILHMCTVAVPLQLVEDRMPRGLNHEGLAIKTDRGIGALLYAQIRALNESFLNFSEAEGLAAKWSTVELISAAIAGCASENPRSLSTYHLQRLQNYIIQNLHDCNLSVTKIAADNRISVRYIHKLFSISNTSVSRWILEQRLERCRDAFATHSNGKCIVKEIAFRWGFNDTAHFSRVFKKRYNQSPKEYWLSIHNHP